MDGVDRAWRGPSMETSASEPWTSRQAIDAPADRKWQAIVSVAVAYVFSAVAVYLYYDRQHLLADLEARGRYVNGVVTAAERHWHRKTGTRYTLKYRYEARGGVHTGSTRVSRADAHRAHAGDYVSVIYDPASPGRHVARSVADARQDLFVAACIGGVVLAILWGGALRYYWLSRATTDATANGQ